MVASRNGEQWSNSIFFLSRASSITGSLAVAP